MTIVQVSEGNFNRNHETDQEFSYDDAGMEMLAKFLEQRFLEHVINRRKKDRVFMGIVSFEQGVQPISVTIHMVGTLINPSFESDVILANRTWNFLH
ncbi:hypothetical protein K0U07_04440 [bacterium]|nr:hypothetical protein [bacterium]